MAIIKRLFWSAALGSVLMGHAAALGWGGTHKKIANNVPEKLSFSSDSLNIHKSPGRYAETLSELQALESEPLCHRIAARLLVNNCQLLDGQDDATVMTNTGRAARDFVDFFAASLAICDLERANFEIPTACYKFREGVLVNLPAPSQPQLHVVTREIDNCLEGLARSDSAWNTWVSYRHKALRFCEAARADNEKDQHIVLHRRLATILEKLTNHAENEIQLRLQKFEDMFQKSQDDAENFMTQLDTLRAKLLQFDHIISNSISTKSEEVEVAIQDGIKGARSIQQLAEAMSLKMMLKEQELVHTYESAMDMAIRQVSQGMTEVMETLMATAVTSTAIKVQIENSERQMVSILGKQAKFEEGLERLDRLAENVTYKHKIHDEMLRSAQNQTSRILVSLETVSYSIGSLQQSFLKLSPETWWPFIFCPAGSLILGSYGLPPSMTRNVILLITGELLGVFMAFKSHYGRLFSPAWLPIFYSNTPQFSNNSRGSIISPLFNNTLESENTEM